MTITIPPELQWVSYLVGSEWPQGDEEGMWRIADHWRTAADELTALIPDLNQVRSETMSVLAGETANAAEEEFAMLFDGDYSVDKLATAMTALGDLADGTGTDIEYTKIVIISSLVLAAIEIAWAIGAALPTAGASLSTIPVTQAATRASVWAAVRALLWRTAGRHHTALNNTLVRRLFREAAEDAALSTLQETAIQGYQMSQGNRNNFDWKQYGQVVASSAIAGGVDQLSKEGLERLIGGAVADHVVKSSIKGAVNGYIGGTLGNAAGQLATGGQLDAASLWGSGATTSIKRAAAEGVRAHTGNIPNAPGNDGTPPEGGPPTRPNGTDPGQPPGSNGGRPDESGNSDGSNDGNGQSSDNTGTSEADSQTGTTANTQGAAGPSDSTASDGAPQATTAPSEAGAGDPSSSAPSNGSSDSGAQPGPATQTTAEAGDTGPLSPPPTSEAASSDGSGDGGAQPGPAPQATADAGDTATSSNGTNDSSHTSNLPPPSSDTVSPPSSDTAPPSLGDTTTDSGNDGGSSSTPAHATTGSDGVGDTNLNQPTASAPDHGTTQDSTTRTDVTTADIGSRPPDSGPPLTESVASHTDSSSSMASSTHPATASAPEKTAGHGVSSSSGAAAHNNAAATDLHRAAGDAHRSAGESHRAAGDSHRAAGDPHRAAESYTASAKAYTASAQSYTTAAVDSGARAAAHGSPSQASSPSEGRPGASLSSEPTTRPSANRPGMPVAHTADAGVSHARSDSTSPPPRSTLSYASESGPRDGAPPRSAGTPPQKPFAGGDSAGEQRPAEGSRDQSDGARDTAESPIGIPPTHAGSDNPTTGIERANAGSGPAHPTRSANDCGFGVNELLAVRYGRDDVSLDAEAGPRGVPARALYEAWGTRPDYATYQQIHDNLMFLGHNSAAIVASRWSGGPDQGGHAYLAVNNHGRIELLDSDGTRSGWPPHWGEHAIDRAAAGYLNSDGAPVHPRTFTPDDFRVADDIGDIGNRHVVGDNPDRDPGPHGPPTVTPRPDLGTSEHGVVHEHRWDPWTDHILPDGAPETHPATADGVQHVDRTRVEYHYPKGTHPEFPTHRVIVTEATVDRSHARWTVIDDGVGHGVHRTPVRGEFTIREVYDKLERARIEEAAQHQAQTATELWHPGHMLGYRFGLNQGLDNLFSQSANFNVSGYKRVENEWGDWVRNGGEVRARVDLVAPTPTMQPDRVQVNYRVVNTDTGEVVHRQQADFANQPKQQFDRVPKTDMPAKMLPSHSEPPHRGADSPNETGNTNSTGEPAAERPTPAEHIVARDVESGTGRGPEDDAGHRSDGSDEYRSAGDVAKRHIVGDGGPPGHEHLKPVVTKRPDLGVSERGTVTERRYPPWQDHILPEGESIHYPIDGDGVQHVDRTRIEYHYPKGTHPDFPAQKVIVTEATVDRTHVKWTVINDGMRHQVHKTPVRAEFTIREVYDSLHRSPNESDAQDIAQIETRLWHPGEMLGQRFALNQGLDNLFSQSADLNTGAYSTIEGEWADWVRSGGEVHGRVDLIAQTPTLHPDRVQVNYRVVDPDTGQVVHRHTADFANQPGERSGRFPREDMPEMLRDDLSRADASSGVRQGGTSAAIHENARITANSEPTRTTSDDGGNNRPPTDRSTGDGDYRPARDILDEARARHREERDQMDRADKAQRLERIAEERGVTVDELPRTPEYHVDSTPYMSRLGPEYAAEIERQRELQQHGMNTKTVEETLHNMDNRDRPPSAPLRNQLRAELQKHGVEALLAAGYSPSEADALAARYALEQFPRGGSAPQQLLHNQDMYFGGHRDPITYGDGPVNNAFGAFSDRERARFQRWLRSQDPQAIVNVRLG